ncbi:hypothetical protein ACHQM5_008777 [Ranunculus cassubicifolius]
MKFFTSNPFHPLSFPLFFFHSIPFLNLKVSKHTLIDSLLIIHNDSYENRLIYFFSPSHGNPYQLRFPPQFSSGKIFGYSEGWIVLEQDNGDLQLLRLFSCSDADVIHLPRLPYESKQVKIRFSPDKSTALAIEDRVPENGICNFVLYFCRPKLDLSWTPIEVPRERQWTSVIDVIYSKGKFYAISNCGIIMVVGASVDGIINTTLLYAQAAFGWTYLLDSPGHGVVFVNLSMRPGEKFGHWIDNYDTSGRTDSNQVVEHLGFIKDIGDHAVFISCHHSCVISTSDFPYFKKNMIYTTPDSFRCWPGEVKYCNNKPSALGGRSLVFV